MDTETIVLGELDDRLNKARFLIDRLREYHEELRRQQYAQDKFSQKWEELGNLLHSLSGVINNLNMALVNTETDPTVRNRTGLNVHISRAAILKTALEVRLR